VIEAVSAAAGCEILTRLAPRRPGDPAELVADASRIRAELGWAPRHDNLAEIVQTALAWEQNCTIAPIATAVNA
jgi:UDP-glucose 4-epimerase